MSPLQRITRQPNVVLGVVTAGINMLVILEAVGWDEKQVSAVNIFAAALFALVALFVTPSSEVVVQQEPGGEITAKKDLRGVSKGDTVWVAPADPPNPEGGYMDLLVALVTVVLSIATGLGLIFGWQVMLVLIVMTCLVGWAVARKRAYVHSQGMTIPLDHLGDYRAHRSAERAA